MTLVPVIGIVQVGMQARADRYTYVPLVGLFVIVVWGASELAGEYRRPLSMFGCAAVAVLAAGAYVQAGYWHDSERLYRRALELLALTGRYEEAVAEFAEALRLDPGNDEVRNQLEHARSLRDGGRSAVPQ